MTLIRRKQNWCDPFEIFEDLEKGISRRSARDWDINFTPDLDVTEDGDNYKAHIDVPGLKKEDLDISIENRVLTIKGERKETQEKSEKGYHYTERRFGSFARVVQLPTEVDESRVKATYKDGVLEIVIPKSEKVKPKQVQVEVK